MATIVNIDAGDSISSSRSDINTNFTNPNNDKLETSAVDTDTTLSANSDAKVPSQKAVKAFVESFTGQTYLVPTGAILPYGGTNAPANYLLCNGAAVSRATYAALFALLGTTYGPGDGSLTFNLPNLQGRFPLGYAASAPTKTLTFSSRSGDTITVTGADNHAHNEIQTGQAVLYDTTSGAIGGPTDNTTYYLIRVAYNQFKLATSVANANAGTAITLSSDGPGTQTFTLTYTARPLGQTGGEETHALTDAEMPSHTHDLGSIATDNPGSPDAVGLSGSGAIPVARSDAPHNIMPLFTVVNYIIKT